MDFYDFFLFYLLLSILNIPIYIIFKKAWANYFNAFIPFKNIVSYLDIVWVKRKFLYSSIVVLVSLAFYFCVCTSTEYLNNQILVIDMLNFWGLLRWFFLLLTIPVYMIFLVIFWIVFSIFSFFMYFIAFIRSWNWAFGFILMPLILSISIFLSIFYCKVSYKLALWFWWKRKSAILYVIFQPIAVWILAFWKWKYVGDSIVTTWSEKNITDKTWNEVNIISNEVTRTLDNESRHDDSLSEVSEQWKNQSSKEVKSLVLKFCKLMLWFILWFILSLLFLFFLLCFFIYFKAH